MADGANDLLFSIKVTQIYNGLVLLVLGLLGIVGYFTRRTITDTESRDKEIELRVTNQLEVLKKDVKNEG